MTEPIFALAYGALAVAALSSCLKYMHMFQLNSYKWKEHAPWMRRNVRPLLLLAGLSLLTALFCFLPAVPAALASTATALIYAFTARPKAKKKSKKPLVYTARVKRMFLTEALLWLLCTLLTAWLLPSALAPVGIALCLLLLPYFCLMANVINAPIEKAIRHYYTEDARRRLNAHPSLKVVAVTGSYGKTGTKHYLNTLLSEKYEVLMTPGNYNTPMGVVLTVRSSLRATHEIFICEMGAKYVGDIRELCELAKPTMGLLTSIGAQHLETFGCLENIVNTKLELADYLREHDGLLLLNGDNALLYDNRDRCPRHCISGSRSDADVRVSDIRASVSGTSFALTFPNGECVRLSVKLLGAHNVSNVALAAAAAFSLGMTPEEIRRAATRLESAPHRLQLLRHGPDLIIDDAYNANPAGTRAALDTLALFDACRILVTPGMVELSDSSDAFNTAFGQNAAEVCDYILLVGPKQTKPIYDGARAAGFPEERLHVLDTVEQALALAFTLPATKQRVVLMENDLPDNY